MVVPRCSKRGWADRKAASGPPTMIESRPSRAPTSPPETGASSRHGTLGGGLLGQTFGHSRGGGGEIDQNLRMVRGLQGAMLTRWTCSTSEGNETMEQQIVCRLPHLPACRPTRPRLQASSGLWIWCGCESSVGTQPATVDGPWHCP